MIIINLKGGLGNQMFQYAAGRALSLRQQEKTEKKIELKLDISGYSENNGIDTARHYALDVFKINVEVASQEEIRKLKYPYGIISKGLRFLKTKILRRFNIGFISGIYNAKKSIYLDGFFQTEKYFIDKEEDIRSAFELSKPFGSKALEIQQRIISAPNSVSLHVRRGDYVKDTKTNKHHGTCDAEYYKIALDQIRSKISKDISIFVFSDDVEWVRDNMPITHPTTYVSSPEIKDYEELILMSSCEHNIIANSSFSWWGAWLNQNKNKIVMAPREWVRTGKSELRDICPTSWIRI